MRKEDFPRQYWATQCIYMGKLFRNPHWDRLGRKLIVEHWVYRKLK